MLTHYDPEIRYAPYDTGHIMDLPNVLHKELLNFLTAGSPELGHTPSKFTDSKMSSKTQDLPLFFGLSCIPFIIRPATRRLTSLQATQGDRAMRRGHWVSSWGLMNPSRRLLLSITDQNWVTCPFPTKLRARGMELQGSAGLRWTPDSPLQWSPPGPSATVQPPRFLFPNIRTMGHGAQGSWELMLTAEHRTEVPRT